MMTKGVQLTTPVRPDDHNSPSKSPQILRPDDHEPYVQITIDDEAADEITTQLELLAAIRDSGVREIALRANGLSDAAPKMIKNPIESTRQLEGLDE